MAASFDVCIRGAGIVGRTLALLLARERLQVALIAAAKPPQTAPDVRAYALSPAVRAVLESVRGWPADALAATPVLAMQVHGDQQGAVHFSAAQQGVPALGWIVDVPALERQLEQACHYQSGITPVTVPAPDPISAPLTVICEGRASGTRAALGVDYESVHYTQQAIATRAECEKPHGQIARQWFTADGDILAFLPLGGPQGKEVAVIWSVQQARLSDSLAEDDAAFAERLQAISGNALGALRLNAPRAHWPLLLARAVRWVGAWPDQSGSFALAGDAAHAMHPLAGQGVNFGLGDAAELARVIAARQAWRSLSDLKLLRRYERARQAQWLRFAAATDGLQRLFTRPEPGVAWLRNQAMQWFDRITPIKSRAARAAMGLD
ncbi:MAG: FAD-dependent monooxygenase [Burkholderiaceae bacterium]|jgi:ubiquinone biosynthesis UbiH/UbiF/VisC/COQ6 family hydroxylase|nr:FAD-dependent monooxygenase [Burkholderiaceae bacterium]